MPLHINTPLNDYTTEYGLLVKREDMSCSAPGPAFSKTRGVFAHIQKRPEKVIGVLDTYHSQAGHAVAEACSLLGKTAVNFYPVRKADIHKPTQPQQLAAEALGAQLVSMPAGRSAILYHRAKKHLDQWGPNISYMMPNALKLPEMVEETAAEVDRTLYNPLAGSLLDDRLPPVPVLIAISSGTIAAGVIRGFCDRGLDVGRTFILHMGYSRSQDATRKYIMDKVDRNFNGILHMVDQGYSYGDTAQRGIEPPWPSNKYYDLKAFRWWMAYGREQYGQALFWNIG